MSPSESFEFGRLVAQVSAGNYRPSAGTVGALLMRSIGHAETMFAAREVASFAAAAFSAEGEWWLMALEGIPSALTADDAAQVHCSWSGWLAGRPVFGGKR